MLQCPQCTKSLPELARKCPFCMAELDLLVDYLSQLQTGLEQADSLTRQGELGRAVWAYLSVLEVDPDNSIARRQVGQVATAVRQFDRTAPGRRWLLGVRGEDGDGAAALLRWLRVAFVVVLVGTAFALGYAWGTNHSGGGDSAPPAQPVPRQQPTLGGS